jgi:alpha-N-acetylglucosaminidase
MHKPWSKVLFILVALFSLAAWAAPEEAAGGLIQRLLPTQADKFVIETIPPENGKDVFEIESREGKIVLRGNNGVSLASALNWYLKYQCHCQVSWCGDQLNLPNPLPLPEKTRKVSPHTYRYAFNYCTFGYAMAFWDWPRWEREIDFMALHGINAPLSVTGAEVVYRNVYRDLGIPDAEIGKFIAGPPYLPWFLMNNLDGFGGPNPESWYLRQEALQKKILARERELGMKPVLTVFTGHVPAALKQKYPQAKIKGMAPWGGFRGGVQLLDPTDPLFLDIGARFMKETIRLYGTDHLYSADTFNEVDPPSTDPEYIKGMGQKVYQSMAATDPEAVWFMQGWLFLFSAKFWTQPRIDALLSGIPGDHIVILDLFGDGKPQWNRTNAFSGKPWIWGIINNWGGKQGMYGRLTTVGVELPKLLGNPAAGKLSGIGTLNEGNDNNPIVYEQLYEMAWHQQPLEVKAWVDHYVLARYGKDNPSAKKAWQLMHGQLYECKDTRHGPQGNFLAMVPPSLGKDGSNFSRASIFYDTGKICEALRLLLAASDDLGTVDTYRFDLVDLGRQMMSDLAQQKLHAELRAALAAKDAKRFDLAAAAYLEAIRDCDRLLRSHRMFQLGRYLKYPRAAGASDAENAQWERNARRLITQWGGSLAGYAQRQYGGLMADYNYGCWKILLDGESARLHGTKAQAESVGAFTETWINDRKPYPEEAEGDTIAIVRQILEKYSRPAASAAVATGAQPIVGKWSYTADGKKYVREFREDGSLHLCINGASHAGWKGFTWTEKDGEVSCRKADGTVFGKHRLQDPQTLLFIGEPHGPASREIDNRE